jgi:hypothetical protein
VAGSNDTISPHLRRPGEARRGPRSPTPTRSCHLLHSHRPPSSTPSLPARGGVAARRRQRWQRRRRAASSAVLSRELRRHRRTERGVGRGLPADGAVVGDRRRRKETRTREATVSRVARQGVDAPLEAPLVCVSVFFSFLRSSGMQTGNIARDSLMKGTKERLWQVAGFWLAAAGSCRCYHLEGSRRLRWRGPAHFTGRHIVGEWGR